MSKKLLVDKGGFVGLQLTESSDGKWVVRGEFGRADVPTENRRVYPKSIWEKEISRVLPMIREGKVYLEPEHPTSGKTSLSRVAGLMKDLRIEPNGQIMGEAVLLDNEHGNQIKSILKAGGKVGVSSRGMGSTKPVTGGLEEVQDDFQYITHDFVAEPAVVTSYPEVFVEEKKGDTMDKVQSMSKEAVGTEVTATLMESPVKTFTEEEVKKIISEQTEVLKKEIERLKEGKMKEMTMEDETKVEVEVEVKPEGKESEGEKNEETTEVAAESDCSMKEETSYQIHVSHRDIVPELKAESLQSELEEANKKIAQMERDAEKLVESVKRLSLGLLYEREKIAFPMPDKFEQWVGSLSSIHTEAQLSESVRKAKLMVKEMKLQESRLRQEMQLLERKKDMQNRALQKKLAEEKNAARAELINKKKQIASLYMEEKIKGHSHAPKLRKLLEGVTDKERIDRVISEYSVGGKSSSEYNSIQRRLSGMDGVRLVEKQLNEAVGISERDNLSDQVISEGVDAQIAELSLASLQEVKGLAGVK